LAQGRKWKVVLFSKATANALSQKAARDKVGKQHPRKMQSLKGGS